MKKLSFMIVATGLLAASVITSCKKEEVKTSKQQNNKSNLRGGTTYSSFACQLPGGGSGCECVISTTDENCSLQTSCLAANMNYPSYWALSVSMFTPQELDWRTVNNVPITEPQLLNALLNDGFPIIP